MPRLRTIQLGELNLVASPHPEGIYREIIVAMQGRRVPARGTEWALVGPVKDGADFGFAGIMFGEVLFHTEIALGGAWLDLVAKGEASSDAIEEINIPDNLRPNMRAMRFFLRLKDHRLVFELKNEKGDRFSAHKVKKVFENLSKSIQDDYKAEAPEISITVVPRHDAIEAVLRVPNMNKLFIRLERPNPDDLGGEARRLMQKLEAEHASRQDIVLVKSKGAQSLTPLEETKTIAEVAATTGFVHAQGHNADGTKATAQTTDYPMINTVPFDDGDDPLGALFAYVWRADED